MGSALKLLKTNNKEKHQQHGDDDDDDGVVDEKKRRNRSTSRKRKDRSRSSDYSGGIQTRTLSNSNAKSEAHSILYSKGDIVKALDMFTSTDGRRLYKWRLAEVLSVRKETPPGETTKSSVLRLRYVGWSEKFDTDVTVPSERLDSTFDVWKYTQELLGQLKEGDEVYVKDIFRSSSTKEVTHKWRKAEIRRIDLGERNCGNGSRVGRGLFVHFVGWKEKWDSWIDVEGQEQDRVCLPLQEMPRAVSSDSTTATTTGSTMKHFVPIDDDDDGDDDDGCDDDKTYRKGDSSYGTRRRRRRWSSSSEEDEDDGEDISERQRQRVLSKKTKLCCDACDGPHLTDKCPKYSKKGIAMAKNLMSKRRKGLSGNLMDDLSQGSGGYFVLSSFSTRVVRQPGDGSCLFHSLAHGLAATASSSSFYSRRSKKKSGYGLRQEICSYLRKHPDMNIAGEPLRKWIQWAGHGTVRAYASRMSGSMSWGGGIEMALFSRMFKRNVHVYEANRRGYKRISRFNVPDEEGTVHVLYSGRAHFDALVPRSTDVGGRL